MGLGIWGERSRDMGVKVQKYGKGTGIWGEKSRIWGEKSRIWGEKSRIWGRYRDMGKV